MKKVYQKPVLLKEKFQMEEMIAGDCGVINNNMTQSDECNYLLPNVPAPLFATGWQSCYFFIEDYEKSGLTSLCKSPGTNNLWSS